MLALTEKSPVYRLLGSSVTAIPNISDGLLDRKRWFVPVDGIGEICNIKHLMSTAQAKPYGKAIPICTTAVARPLNAANIRCFLRQISPIPPTDAKHPGRYLRFY